MHTSCPLRLFGLSILGGFLAGVLVVLLLRQQRRAQRLRHSSEIVLAEISS